jgi:hypothetical protein
MDDETKNFLDSLRSNNLDAVDTSALTPEIPNVEIEERDFELIQPPTFVNPTDNDISFDYVLIRSTLYSLLAKTGNALEFAIQLSKIDQNSKTLQSVCELSNTMRNITSDILKNQKDFDNLMKTQRPKEEKALNEKPVSLTGTPLDLRRAIKGN